MWSWRSARCATGCDRLSAASRHRTHLCAQVNDADGKFVTDVLYRSRDDGNVLHRVEVWNKHKTSPESRCGKVPWL